MYSKSTSFALSAFTLLLMSCSHSRTNEETEGVIHSSAYYLLVGERLYWQEREVGRYRVIREVKGEERSRVVASGHYTPSDGFSVQDELHGEYRFTGNGIYEAERLSDAEWVLISSGKITTGRGPPPTVPPSPPPPPSK